MTSPEHPRARTRFDFAEPVPPARSLGRVHFIAIGGSGVSGVALLFLAAGATVTGSDAADGETLRLLAEHGATVHVGHDAAHLGDADTVIVSAAVRESNPELAAARARGLRVLHRAQGIAALTTGREVVAVAGANGKTTTSAMTVAALGADGVAPGFVIGAPLSRDGSSAATGSGPFVVEADESDGSFVAYAPQVAVVTNIAADHLDFFGDLEGVHRGFTGFVDTLAADGTLVTNADDEGATRLAQLARRQGRTVVTWGESEGADVRIGDVTQVGRTCRATLVWARTIGAIEQGTHRSLSVPMPGRHNLHNATAAVLVATAGCGHRLDPVLGAIGDFAGTRRRFELVGRVGGVEVVDDYAHNPPKVAAVVQAGRSVVGPAGRLVVAFQPHLYSRTAAFAQEFAAALSGADVVVVLDVFGAREAPVDGVDGGTVATALRRLRSGQAPPAPQVHYVPERAAAAAAVATLLHPGDLLLTVGAGDVTRLGPQVLDTLGARDA